MSDDLGRERLRPGDESFQVEEVEISVDTPPETAKAAIGIEQTYATLGMVVGAIIIIAGIALLVLGASGAVDWSFKGFGIDSHLQTGALGIVVSIIGAVVILGTRLKVKITR